MRVNKAERNMNILWVYIFMLKTVEMLQTFNCRHVAHKDFQERIPTEKVKLILICGFKRQATLLLLNSHYYLNNYVCPSFCCLAFGV